MRIGELFVELGVHSDMQKINEFVSGMRRGVLESAAFIAGLVGITMTLKNIFDHAMQSSESLRTFKNATGLSTAELQKWQMAGDRVGIKAETMQSNIESLNKTLNEVKYGKAPPEGFMFLGLSTHLNAFQTLLRIREKIQGMDATRATYLLSSMGISPDMMNLLKMPKPQFDESMRTGNLLYLEEQQKKMLALTAEIAKTRQEWVKFSTDLLTLGLPALKKIIEMLDVSVSALIKFRGAFTGHWVDLFKMSVGYTSSMGGGTKTNNVTVNIHTSANPTKDVSFNKHLWDTILSLEGAGGAQ